MPPRTKPSDVRKLQAFKSRINHFKAVHKEFGVEVSTSSLTSGQPIPGKNAKERKLHKLKMRKAHYKRQMLVTGGTLHEDDENWDPTLLHSSIDTSLALEPVQENQQWAEDDDEYAEDPEDTEYAADSEDAKYAEDPEDAGNAEDSEDAGYVEDFEDADEAEDAEDAGHIEVSERAEDLPSRDTVIDLGSKTDE